MNTATTEKKDTKVGLLLLPEELFRNYIILQSLHILKTDKGINYTVADISRTELKLHYSSLPDEGRAQLLKFQPDLITAHIKETELLFA